MDIVEYKRNTSENRHPWELARLEVIYTFIKKYYSEQSKANILDVGCGDTYVVSELHNRIPNSSFFAIDTAFSQEMIKAFEQDGINLFQSIDSLGNRIDKANVVLLMDVIEHIENDKEFLSSLVNKDYINHDTLFLITVPAYQSLFSEHDVFLNHYRRYSRKQLVNTLNSSGFDIIESGNFFSSLLAPRLLNLGKEKIFGKPKSQGLAAWQGSKKQSNILKEVLYLDFKTTNLMHRLGLKIPGLSTYALCRKSVL
ncbi:MAG: methyltransferase domain-containing protein [Bacteroidales bacterium]|nr:methyltransferase domain-containing protein [Bacteroidales bacterium]